MLVWLGYFGVWTRVCPALSSIGSVDRAFAEFDAMQRAQAVNVRSNAIALPSGEGQQSQFWQEELLKPLSEEPPAEQQFWQFHVLEAIMEVDIRGLTVMLGTLDAEKLKGGLRISRVPPQATLYVLANETFSPSVEAGGLLGSNFSFERQKLRACIGRWLEMIGAQEGDTLLHLALRLSGADERQKTAIVVEIIGHGASFEVVNALDQLPSQIDPPCFKHAFFKVLPVWRRAQAQLRAQEQTATDMREAAASHAAHMERRVARHAARDAAVIEAARLAEKRAEEERARVIHHQRLHHAMDKVAKREAREVFRDQGNREMLKDLAALGLNASWLQHLVVRD